MESSDSTIALRRHFYLLLGTVAGVIGSTLPALEAALADPALLDPNQLLKTLNAPGETALEADPASPETPAEPEPEP